MKNILLLVVTFSFMIQAQEYRPLRREAMERLESLKKVRMLESVKLSEEDGLRLVNKYSKHRDEIMQLEKERADILDKLEKQYQTNASDDEYRNTFMELVKAEQKLSETRINYLNNLKEVLAAKQLAEYLLFERSFAKEIREMARKIRKEREKD
jgi:hypothetical protein